MNFPITHPVWMWLYFGAFGSTGAILFTIIVWHWRKIYALSKGHQRSVARWGMAGYMFLFFAMWFACGIGGPPGNMLSSDPVTQNLSYAITAGVLSIFFSVPGWACVLVSQRKMLRDIQSDKTK